MPMPLPGQPVQDQQAEINFNYLRNNLPGRILRGQTTITWPGGASLSNSITVTHGLGTTPYVINTQAMTQSGTNAIAIMVTAYSSTTFTIRATTVDASTPLSSATNLVGWMALT